MKRIAILASGSGTNAENIARYFANSEQIELALILCNKKGAGVFERADKLGVPAKLFSRDDFYQTNRMVKLLQEERIDLVVLAGFLWLIPESLLKAFPDRIVNIHPALLPKYGGKGMYGINVHRSVLENKERETGISIHLVNEQYDEGRILFQKSVSLDDMDTPERVAEKVHALEYEYFPRVIETYLKQLQ